MLKLLVFQKEGWDETKQEFVGVDPFELEMEHSLASVSKWESIFEKPFLVPDEKTPEEVLAYFECMNLTPDVPPEVFKQISDENVKEINTYMNSKQHATWFNDEGAERSNEIVTSEIIYYWMSALQIDWQAQYWHINKLLALVRVANMKNQPPKKMTPAERAARNRDLNARRKAQLGTRG